MTTSTSSRGEVIETLASARLGEDVGIGGYSETAAYKWCNGDISETTAGLTDEVREAIRAAKLMRLDWEDFGY